MALSVERLGEVEHERQREPSALITPEPCYESDLRMTLADMRVLGVRELNVLCLNPACRHEITFSADDYASEIEMSWFRSRMICARCGDRRLDVRPNWKEQPTKPTKLRYD
jgi:hypothetical protein